MIKLHHYSKEKFIGFTPEKQIKSIIELLVVLEHNLSDTAVRNNIIASIQECIDWSMGHLPSTFDNLKAVSQSGNPHEIIRLIAPLINHYKHNQKDYEPDIFRFDGIHNQMQNAPFPLTVILDNLRSAYNVGSIFRTAECVKAAKLFLCGITPSPPNPKLSKTAMQTIDRLQWEYQTQTMDAILQLKNVGIPVVALETTTNAISLFNFEITQPVGLILGNEALGIEEDILKQADIVLSIPVLGWKNSLNVCNAFAVAAYQLSGIK